jgi:hypothetical protein
VQIHDICGIVTQPVLTCPPCGGEAPWRGVSAFGPRARRASFHTFRCQDVANGPVFRGGSKRNVCYVHAPRERDACAGRARMSVIRGPVTFWVAGYHRATP